MRLSWNEIRARAAKFADDWKDASYEKGEAQSFYNDFFEVFGVRRRTVARYEEHVAKLDDRHGFIDLFWPGVLIVEQKSAGRDLRKAYDQAGEYFDALPERDRPRHILVSDFPHLPGSQQERADAETGGNANAIPCQRAAYRAVPGHPGSQFRAPRIRPDRLARTAHYSQQPHSRSGKRHARRFCLADLGHAHGLAAPYRRAA